VTALLRAADGALWIEMAHGLARYVARGEVGRSRCTLLEAFRTSARGESGPRRGRARPPLGVHRLAYPLRRRDFPFQAAGRASSSSAGPIALPAGEAVPRGAWRFRRAGSA
jgi:hypothetical protein